MTTYSLQSITEHAVASSNNRVNATRQLISQSQAIRLESQAQREKSKESRYRARSLVERDER